MFLALLLSASLASVTPAPSPTPKPTASPIPLTAYFAPPNDMSISLAPVQLSGTMQRLFMSIRPAALGSPWASLNLVAEHLSAPLRIDQIIAKLPAQLHSVLPHFSDLHVAQIPICAGTLQGVHATYKGIVSGKAFAFEQVLAMDGVSADTLTYVRFLSDAADPKIAASLMTLCPQPYEASKVLSDDALLAEIAPLPVRWHLLVDKGLPSAGQKMALTLLRSAQALVHGRPTGEEFDVFMIGLPMSISGDSGAMLAQVATSAMGTMLKTYKNIHVVSRTTVAGCSGTEQQPQDTYSAGQLSFITRYSMSATGVFFEVYRYPSISGPNPEALASLNAFCAKRSDALPS